MSAHRRRAGDRWLSPATLFGAAIVLGGFALRLLDPATDDWLFGGILVLGAGIAFNAKMDRLLTAVARVITAWRRRGEPPAPLGPEAQPGPPRPPEARDGD